MARKRMLDPQIWRDRKVIKLNATEVLIWIGCISVADDEGIFEPDPEALHFEFGRFDVNPQQIGTALNRLEDLGMLVKYDDDAYAFLPNWYKHQTLNRPKETKLRRPPRSIVEQYPEYVRAWESSFSYYRKDDEGKREHVQAEYPYRPDPPKPVEPKPERELVYNPDGPFTGQSLINHAFNTDATQPEHGQDSAKGIEEKGKEENRSEEKGIPVGDATDPPSEDEKETFPLKDPLANQIKNAFLAQKPWEEWGNIDKELGQVRNIAKKVRKVAALTGSEPTELAKRMLSEFLRMKNSRREDFWRNAAFTPAQLMGRWDAIIESLRHQQENGDVKTAALGRLARMGVGQ